MGQLGALFYKNWILYKRSLIGNIIQLLVPVLIIMFIVLVRDLVKIKTYPQQSFIDPPNITYVKDYSISTISQTDIYCDQKDFIGLAPKGDILVDRIALLLDLYQNNYQLFQSEAALQAYIRDPAYINNKQVCYAITVQSSSNNLYQYSLRFNASTDGFDTNQQITSDQNIDLNVYSNSELVMAANTLVNIAILQLKTNSDLNALLSIVAPIYQEAYTLDTIYDNLSMSLGTIVLLPLMLIYLRQTSIMLQQKETKVREAMSIMGMKIRNYYFTWFVRYYLVYICMHFICSLIITNQLPHIPFYVPFIVFVLFDLVLIIQNFFIQVFLTRAKIGVVISLLFFVLQYVLSFISANSNNPSLSVNASISIIPHAAFILAFQTMLYAESNQITPNFSDTLNHYVIGYALVSFVVNSIVYLILTWYLDQVVPNEWGAKKHPLFCCVNKGSSLTLEQKQQRKLEQQANPDYRDNVEEVDENLKQLQRQNKMIQIVGLRKEFNGGETVAVKNLTVNMYNNQIFSLLGHNGAGKTTSISMLTGMIAPSDGFISVFGEVDLDKIRAMIGVCPQHDTLYEDLTVKEHIELFATFKGLKGEQLQAEINKLINDVNLEEKRDEYSKNLSGGQKRRLSVALAFAGRSKVIILDEPTSGMDTSARRYIWQLLKTYKNDRVIILTTHFMDQADYLGDRIGIMGNGKMICCGSSIYLKNKFGVGYNITFVKKGNEVDSNPIIQVVKKHIPNTKVLSNIATDLSMQLPLEGLAHFAGLFKEIDERQQQLKFAEYGVSITTLEQVFLRVAEQAQNEDTVSKDLHSESQAKDLSMPDLRYQGKVNKNLQVQDIKQPLIQGQYDFIPRQQRFLHQLYIHFNATFLKRLRVIRRDYKSFIFQLLLPILIIIFALLLMRVSFIQDSASQTQSFDLYLSEQNPVVVPIGSNSPAFATLISNQLSQQYGSLISVIADTTGQTVGAFDSKTLFSKKLQMPTLKGGIYFNNITYISSVVTVYQYFSVVNTRSPSSFLFLPTLAAETVINNIINNPNDRIKIQVANYPMPRTYQQLQINNTISGFFASFIFSIALAFKFASIMAFIVKEREDRSKHQQIVSGMKLSAYWTANFVYDYVLYLIVAIATVLLCKGFDITSLTKGDAFTGLWLLFILYGLAYISLTYIVGFAFKEHGNAQASFFFLTFIVGGMLPVLINVLRFIGTSSNSVGRGLAWFLRIYPAFSFGEGLLNLGSINLYGLIQNGGRSLDPLAMEISLAPIIYLAVETVVYFVLLFIVQNLLMNQSFMRYFTFENSVQETKAIVQQDVLKQYQLANAADPADYEILTKNLRKVFIIDSAKKHKVAVDNLSFAVKRGQVFGLLGVNGAGKSTTFKMLAGEITSTSGDSYFNGLKISENLDKVRQGLGYCPQFDALISNLTVKQQLQMFYDMKSLRPEYKERAIEMKINEMNLQEYRDKLSGTLSGGNKRKLSVAMAMIGNPRIVFLDEPSTGMDPKARRFMWKVISRVATEKKNSTVILTTHSMEEAQALSSRLGIMVKGNFKCIGTPQHIKSKYGEGFQIEIKLNNLQRNQIEGLMTENKLQDHRIVRKTQLAGLLVKLKVDAQDCQEISENGSGNFIYNALQMRNEIDMFTLLEFLQVCRLQREIMNYIRNQFGEVELLERLQTFIRLKIKAKAKVSKLFQFFESSKRKFSIQQYTIKQATVQQIFNRFAQEQEPQYES